ncbi:MAG: hypothetical protein KIS92_21425 [Planctomycetota bacterium]|nr:hypothetical protein [Planctomycetota bacterium]
MAVQEQFAPPVPEPIPETVHGMLASGDEAVAWGALDSNVRLATGYPGTPATDIMEAVIRNYDARRTRAHWAVNEKVAYETALAVAIGGQRALVAMKQVGLNVAADAFINSVTAGVNGGLVLAVADDPECHSSQNKQDTRLYRALSGTLLLEPSGTQEAYLMTREAFRLSERFRVPVILRLTHRTAYGCAPLKRGRAAGKQAPFAWPKEPQRFFITPNVSRRLFQRLEKLQREFGECLRESVYFHRRDSKEPAGSRTGVLCAGIGFSLAQELLPPEAGLLKVPGEPFAEDEIASFVDAHDRLVVLEEGEALLEDRVRGMTRGRKTLLGRRTGHLAPVGELRFEEVDALLSNREKPALRESVELPPRLPEICKPCGYHKVFGALKNVPGLATPSDIGCNSLGGLPPYSVMDGVWSMGSSIGVACGLAAAGHERVLAIIGDSTFFHAGLPPLVEALHQNYKMTVLLLDNGTTAMTGGQGVAHRAAGEAERRVDLLRVIEALGVARCTPFDPHLLGLEGIQTLVEDSFAESGVKVLVYRSQCGLYSPGYHTEKPWALAPKRNAGL